MTKSKLPANQFDLFGGAMQMAMLSEWRDLTATEKTDKGSDGANGPLPGQLVLSRTEVGS